LAPDMPKSPSNCLKTRKNLEPKKWLVGLVIGRGELGQKCKNYPRYYVNPRKPQTQDGNKNFKLKQKEFPNPKRV